MIQSGGTLVFKSPTTIWRGTTATLDSRALDIIGMSWSYGALYKKQPWVRVLVDKIAKANARLPLKTYRRVPTGREDARDTPYGQLLLRPSASIDPVTFWRWTRSTYEIYGEAFLGKIRDAGGRPIELVPLHPAFMLYDENTADWRYEDSKTKFSIARRDFVWFRHYNPDGTRGLSPLESLRATLENEVGAQKANSALWRNGGRPSVVLEHPGKLTDPAADRLTRSWAEVHGGVDNWAKAALLEEGLKAVVLPLNVEELQYIEARKLNREECCAVFDVPPPAVHILDHATYSNITENLRSLYRDTMAPKLGEFESTLEMDLRDGTFGRGNPDFPDDVYAEWLLDEVLRGEFEARANSYQAGINSGWLTPAEVRQMENRPFIEGSDVLLVNSTIVPLDSVGGSGEMSTRELAETLQKIYLAVGPVISGDEAREILNRDGAGLVGPAPESSPAIEPPEQLALPPGPKSLPNDTLRTLMGRLSRKETLDDVDPTVFAAGIGDAGPVLKLLAEAQRDGLTVDAFKTLLKGVTVEPAESSTQPVFISHTVVNPEKEIPATVVENHNHMEPPIVNVEPAEVNLPPMQVDVHIPEPRGMRRVVERDENGRIVAIVDTPIG